MGTTFKILRLTFACPIPSGPRNAAPFGNEFFARAVGGAELPANISDARIAAIIDVFNTGRDCFYDEDATLFSTDLSKYWQPDVASGSGFVAGWDVRIPTTGDSQIRILVKQEGDLLPTGSAILVVPEEQLALAVAVVRSKRCWFDGTNLLFEKPATTGPKAAGANKPLRA